MNRSVGLLKALFSILLLNLTVLCQAQEEVKFYYPSGKISSKGKMVEGKPDGFWVTYYENGVVKSEGLRTNFMLDSVWRFYNPEGTLIETITYVDNERNGQRVLFDGSGLRKEEQEYSDDIQTGITTQFYPSGNIFAKIPFESGKAQGKAYEFGEDGRIISILTYDQGYVRNMLLVNRYNRQGERKGQWQEYHSNGRVRVEGNYDKDLRNGVFKYYDARGDLQKLETYRAGQLLTDDETAAMLTIGKEFYEDGTIREVGSYRNGKRSGLFRNYNEDGTAAAAQFYENDRKLGEGMVNAKGQRIGPWKLFFRSGDLRAEGEYEEGLRSGAWTFYFASGKVEQKGIYKADLPAGLWRWFFEDGTLQREEAFRRGKEDGAMVEYDREGNTVAEGEYIDGYKTGPWKVTVGDHTEEGEYIDGERHGEWIHTYGDGEFQFKGSYELGMPINKHKYFYKNGNVREEGKHKGGVRDGDWKYYDMLGNHILTIEYRNGEEYKIDGVNVMK